jgi:3-hydroxybutyryl-CoA dehydratase
MMSRRSCISDFREVNVVEQRQAANAPSGRRGEIDTMKEGDVFARRFTIDETVWSGFVGLFGDRNPLHTDEMFAREKGFKGRVMHGNILGGFLSFFIGECLPQKNVIIHNQSISYTNPVYLGETVDFSAEVTGVFESVNAVEFRYRFESNGRNVAKGKIQIGLI